MSNVLQLIGRGGPFAGGLAGGPIHFHIGGPGGGDMNFLPPGLRDLFAMRRQSQPAQGRSRDRDDAATAVAFTPATTSIRWQEEARLLFGTTYLDKSNRVVTHLLKVLVPPAKEEAKVEREKREAEAKRIREEQERVEREKREKEEKERKEREEREAAEAAEKARADEEAAAARTQEAATEGETSVPDAMEGVETAQPEAPSETTEAAPAGPSEPATRTFTNIRGQQVDITTLDIDSEYLEALPEEIREEVIMQQLAEQRSQQAAGGEEPSEIDREFLEALPPELREEILQQEAQDRRRREREQARRNATAAGGAAPPAPEEMDPRDFFAMLEPNLRQTILADQPEDQLNNLPPELIAEARALGGGRLRQFIDGPGRLLQGDRERRVPSGEQATKKPERRHIVQMLDKAGVATLLRLMFTPQQGTFRQSLHQILRDVCENRQNRAEVVSLLLLILQDGSTDVTAVERSFAHLSLRAKQPGTQKTPQPLKRVLTGSNAPVANSEMTPLTVVQQCLSGLMYLIFENAQIAWFFLTEHEISSGMKTKASKKGKGKDDRAAKYALNALLALLDRKLIMESSICMEQLSSLLSRITTPLTMLLTKKDKETQEEAPKKDEEASTGEQTTTAPQSDATAEDTAMTETTPAESAAPTAQPTEAATSTEASGSEVKSESAKKPEEPAKKKQRTLEPPVVPENNLRLVVNILGARECNSKTFRETLATINNLSAIPGAKAVFGEELVAQAQTLAQSILVDLDDLIPHINTAETGTEVQGMALAKFSPASADQAKLLRVLTALDYLFDPKQGKNKPETKSGEDDGVKENVLTTLYESSTFEPLWDKLSECLRAIRQRGNLLNVATILLPLIEALMVVCKNSTITDAKQSIIPREFVAASPPPDAAAAPMENLFMKFTEEHRKILNDLVRHNPKLMSGTFALLVKNPKVLEFDNKRNYFTRRLHSRSEDRRPQPPLQLSVRRDQVFLDSFKSLYFKKGEEMKYGKLSIRFHGEEGVDAGGVTREWFQVLARGMFNPNYALFVPVAADRTTFHPNRMSSVNPEHLMFFNFIGRIIGKALYEGRVLDCHFSRAVYKRMLGKSVSIKDMETLDLDYYKSLLWMLENDITDIITENFSVETDDFGEHKTIDLIENGRNIPVTEENKQEYVQLMVEYKLTGSVQEQLANFLQGKSELHVITDLYLTTTLQASTTSSQRSSSRYSTNKSSSSSSLVCLTSTLMTGRTIPNTTTTQHLLRKFSGSGARSGRSTKKRKPSCCSLLPEPAKYHSMASKS